MALDSTKELPHNLGVCVASNNQGAAGATADVDIALIQQKLHVFKLSWVAWQEQPCSISPRAQIVSNISLVTYVVGS